MWMRDGAGYFFGPIFIHPEETEHEPTKMFYKKEVFLSNLEETCPMTCIIGSLSTMGKMAHCLLFHYLQGTLLNESLFLSNREVCGVVLQRLSVVPAH